MDAITLLRHDHTTIEQLFSRFEKAGARAFVEKRRIVDRIIEKLSVHAVIEEQVFYPVARKTVPETEDMALESLEEHHIMKWVLSELDGMAPEHERFDAKVTVLMENVRHHVREEQDDFFPKVREGLSRTALNDLGNSLAEAKKSAPTHPHPNAPDTPPANAATDAVAGVNDKVNDNLSGLAQSGVTAVQDLIARITGKRPTSAPSVRRTADAVSEGISDTAKTVGKGVTNTAHAATSGAKGTATAARKSAGATARTAKKGATAARRAGTTAAASR